MTLSELYDLVVHSDVYRTWYENHKDSFLSSFFFMKGEGSDTIYLHFYDKDNDRMTSFVVDGEHVSLGEQDVEVFKKPGDVVHELSLDNVSVTQEQALEKTKALLKEKHQGEMVTKWILIIQYLDTTLWNVSAFTSSMNIFHVNIDAENGKVLKEEFQSLLSFKKS